MERMPRRLTIEDLGALSQLCASHNLTPDERRNVLIDAQSANDPNACLDTIAYYAQKRIAKPHHAGEVRRG
jgi:hypothetical protein